MPLTSTLLNLDCAVSFHVGVTATHSLALCGQGRHRTRCLASDADLGIYQSPVFVWILYSALDSIGKPAIVGVAERPQFSIGDLFDPGCQYPRLHGKRCF